MMNNLLTYVIVRDTMYCLYLMSVLHRITFSSVSYEKLNGVLASF